MASGLFLSVVLQPTNGARWKENGCSFNTKRCLERAGEREEYVSWARQGQLRVAYIWERERERERERETLFRLRPLFAWQMRLIITACTVEPDDAGKDGWEKMQESNKHADTSSIYMNKECKIYWTVYLMTEQYPHPKNQFHIEEEVCPTDAKPKFISVEQNLNLMMALTHQTCTYVFQSWRLHTLSHEHWHSWANTVPAICQPSQAMQVVRQLATRQTRMYLRNRALYAGIRITHKRTCLKKKTWELEDEI